MAQSVGCKRIPSNRLKISVRIVEVGVASNRDGQLCPEDTAEGWHQGLEALTRTPQSYHLMFLS
jgi:hypothetical protein